MTGSERRENIVRQIKGSPAPVSGAKLAATNHVSRQVIVQDIALIRAEGYDILSTHRGYVLNEPKSVSKMFKVKHTDEQIEEEMNIVVDQGGCVEDVVVNHKVYGRIEAELHVNSRRKVVEFLEDLKSGKSSPLKNITSDYHYHNISADCEETLDLIERELRRKGFIVDK